MRLVPLTAFVVLGLAACAAPVPSSAPVASSKPTPEATATPISSPTAGLTRYRAPGFTFTYPADWYTVDVTQVLTLGFSSPIAVLANYPLTGCPALDINCLFALNVPQGGVLVSVATGTHSDSSSIFDPNRHWTDTIDRMPARTMWRPGFLGIDEVRDWIVARPGGIWGELVVEGSIRGPGAATRDAELAALARSIRFDVHPAPLDSAAAGAALATAVTSLDKADDPQLPTPAGCFPRSPGARSMRVSTWWGIALPKAVPVTCSSAIEATPVDRWRVTLSVRWEAANGRAGGVWRENSYYDANGAWIGVEQLTPNASPASP